MEQSKKYQILKGQYVDFRHPTDKRKREVRLYRIIALRSFMCNGVQVNKEEIGGYIESEKNLSQEGTAWVFYTAKIFDDAFIGDDSRVGDTASVYGNAKVFGSSKILYHSSIH